MATEMVAFQPFVSLAPMRMSQLPSSAFGWRGPAWGASALVPWRARAGPAETVGRTWPSGQVEVLGQPLHLLVGAGPGDEEAAHAGLPAGVDVLAVHAGHRGVEVVGLDEPDHQAVLGTEEERVVPPAVAGQRLEHLRPHLAVRLEVLLDELRPQVHEEADPLGHVPPPSVSRRGPRRRRRRPPVRPLLSEPFQTVIAATVACGPRSVQPPARPPARGRGPTPSPSSPSTSRITVRPGSSQ